MVNDDCVEAMKWLDEILYELGGTERTFRVPEAKQAILSHIEEAIDASSLEDMSGSMKGLLDEETLRAKLLGGKDEPR